MIVHVLWPEEDRYRKTKPGATEGLVRALTR